MDSLVGANLIKADGSHVSAEEALQNKVCFQSSTFPNIFDKILLLYKFLLAKMCSRGV
jgi:hypothetical protein